MSAGKRQSASGATTKGCNASAVMVTPQTAPSARVVSGDGVVQFDPSGMTPEQALARAAEFALQAAVWLPATCILPNPRNPRIHGEEVMRLARTIVRTAWGAPALVQASTMRIIGGHGRQEAAHQILAGIEVDGFLRGGHDWRFRRGAPPGCIPVCVIDVDDATADAMTLADNARAVQGQDDAALLAEMALGSFDRDAPVMADIGYGAEELDKLLESAGDDLGAAMELHEVDVSDLTDARFWMSIDGPLPSQPDALEALRKALSQMPGVKVNFVG